uniref:midasin-like n=1 Tax=Styela clava TaxID=7725 RepID=UPI001939A84C|nr:midasin-like [Styela clava]
MESSAFLMDFLGTVSMMNKEFSGHLKPYLAKQVWGSIDRNNILDILAHVLLDSADKNTISSVTRLLGPLAADLIYRSLEILGDLGKSGSSSQENFYVILGELCDIANSHAKRVSSSMCLEEKNLCNPSIIKMNDIDHSPLKKRKLVKSVSLSDVVYSMYQMMKCSPQISHNNWPRKHFWECVKENESTLTPLGRWALMNILSALFNFQTKQLKAILVSNIGHNSLLHLQYEICKKTSGSLYKHISNTDSVALVSVEGVSVSHTMKKILCSDLHSKLVMVCGVVLPKVNSVEIKPYSTTPSQMKVVLTKTLQNCLHSVALAVSDWHPVILEGPPDCGKSTLIEYLAHLTGHDSSNFIKIQLGEGIDSKLLSGMYKCTDVSGEFEWQPGALTQAAKNGYWVLLEDIDKAPLDVVSLLLPLLESGQLNVPGHSISDGNNNVSTGFQIFMTCRSDGKSLPTPHSDGRLGVAMLKRHSRHIYMDSLLESDLKSIIDEKYPLIRQFSEKLLEIYTSLENMYSGMFAMDYKSNNRTASARDLFRLCHRLSLHICPESPDNELGRMLALEAIDCFIASSINKNERKAKIQSIHALLNLSSATADYFCQSYNPEIKIQPEIAMFGRVNLHREKNVGGGSVIHQNFAITRSSGVLLERIACAVKMCEPVLLVGETGVGKTSAIQYLAEQCGTTLHIVNISQQSSSSDLLGAFKPIQPKQLISPVRDHFEELFLRTFSQKHNMKFLTHVQACFMNKRFSDLLHLMTHCAKSAVSKLSKELDTNGELIQEWTSLNDSLIKLKQQMKAQNSLAFTFVEGVLSQAIQRGDWLLIDEINLAPPETLDCLNAVLESHEGSISLLEMGDTKPIKRNQKFRIFAAMNPATDVGKKNLPVSIRNRFLELFVSEPDDDSDLFILISHYLKGRNIPNNDLVNGILLFYRQVCEFSRSKIALGMNAQPIFSLRSLCRALRYVVDHPRMTLTRALYEGLSLAFLTEIDHTNYEVVIQLIVKYVIGKNKWKPLLKVHIPSPEYKHASVEGYHIRCGSLEPYSDPKYIITPFVSKHIKILARAVAYGKYPILIQGETSTGKTSIIQYLAGLTGNVVVRINNHEHTDLQEYIGSYSLDESGKFYFQEGPLVTAMREGNWIILDELNLAPTDILESLNRVLDDNRELFITETQERIVAHPRFTLFATQNPPGLYGGRKVLSRALRNRFIELHFGEIPPNEINTILHRRCDLPVSRCNRLVRVMQDLQEHRRSSGIFSGKYGFITIRDLFKWAERYRRGNEEDPGSVINDWDQQLANDGYLLLAGRVRKEDERVLIQQIIQKHFGKEICMDQLFSAEILKKIVGKVPTEFSHIVFTKPLRKLIIMLHRALKFDEPVLLVGETGCGKTTACQLVSVIESSSDFCTINCHAHTDASDFIGGLRPVRVSKDSDNGDDNSKLFDWVDGPLLQAMCHGKYLLIDEISLAEDSVLERLNSVLEPARKLVVPDRVEQSCTVSILTVEAKEGFQFMATMNPGGDFGKKELSPALRNRLTEIWCTVADEADEDVKDIMRHNLKFSSEISEVFADMMVKFIKWFVSTSFGTRYNKSIRDVVKWVAFCNVCAQSIKPLEYIQILAHGALLVFIDSVGSGMSDNTEIRNEARRACISKLLELLSHSTLDNYVTELSKQQLMDFSQGTAKSGVSLSADCFGVGPFSILRGPSEPILNEYCFSAPTTSVNTLRLLRALQLSNPILLEGSPGIGKTSLVMALARAAGHNIVRINLSEQTDISDLIGADLPVDEGVGGQFCWRDGPLLLALKQGSWVVFDELNLASQSVLEGLNSVFDHRNEIFIPELGSTFNVKSEQTRIFACQNPFHQGGGRKGLPKSFLNRFNQVYMDPLSKEDMVLILSSQFPKIPVDMLYKMICFNESVKEQIVNRHQWGHVGGPWEFNLRDMIRWCELILTAHNGFYPEKFVYLIYCERLQSVLDRQKMFSSFYEVFGKKAYRPSCIFHLSSNVLQIGNVTLEREEVVVGDNLDALIFPSRLHSMEGLMTAIKLGWMCILTGHSGSGKTTLVKTLASLIGHRLRTFSVNSSMDATELLGGFEQMDSVRHLGTIIQCLMDACMDVFKANNKSFVLMSDDVSNALQIMDDLKEIRTKIMETTSGASALIHANSILSYIDWLESKFGMDDSMTKLICGVKQCRKKLQSVTKKINESKGCFEWVDSELINALKSGDWLLIDGANLCNPSVLDRLNGLLESNGVLSVTERGIVGGSFVEIRPHPSFRLILSLDASEGNLSRAMRNRGLEIHLLSDRSSQARAYKTAGIMNWDEARLIVFSKLSPVVPNCIISYLLNLFQTAQSSNVNSAYNGMMNCIKCSREVFEELKTGNDIVSCILAVCHRYLPRNYRVDNMREDLETCATTGDTNLTNDLPIMRLENFLHSTDAARVFHQAQMFDSIKRRASQTNCSLEQLFHRACKLFLHLSSYNDYKIRIQLLDDYFFNNDGTAVKYSKAIENVLSNTFFDSYKDEYLDLSWDLRWSSRILDAMNFQLCPEYSCKMNILNLVFTVTIHQQDLNTKLNSILKLLRNNYSRKKKSSRVKKTAQSQSDISVLVKSSLYHSGVIKLQELPHPAIAYLYPLYQNLLSSFQHIVVMQSDVGILELIASVEKIFEIAKIWEQFMETVKFDLVEFFISLKRLQTCLEFFKINSEKSVLIYAKIDDMFNSMNQFSDLDWATVSTQNKIRLFLAKFLLGSLPCQDENDLLCLCKAKTLLTKMSDTSLRLKQNNSIVPANFHFAVAKLCDALSTISIFQIPLMNDQCHVSNLLKSIEDEINAFDYSPHIELKDENNDTVQLHKNNGFEHVSELVPLMHQMISTNLINLMTWLALSEGNANDVFTLVSNFIDHTYKILLNMKISNIKVLTAIQCIQKSMQFLDSNKNCIALMRKQILTTLITVVTENNISDLLRDNRTVSSGASLLLKPYFTKASLEVIFKTMPGGVKTVKYNNSCSIDIGNSYVLLSEIDHRVKEIDLLQHMLWTYSSVLCTPAYAVIDHNILQNVFAYLTYFKSCLDTLITMKGALMHVIEEDTISTLNEIIKAFNCSTVVHKHAEGLCHSVTALSNEVSSRLQNIGSREQLNNGWMKEIKKLFINVVKWTNSLVNAVFIPTLEVPYNCKRFVTLCNNMLGMAWSWAGLLSFTLVSPQNDVDPVVIYKSKCKILNQHTEEIENEIQVFSIYHETMTGELLYSDIDSSLSDPHIHPYLLGRFHRMHELKQKLKKTMPKSATRPPSNEFRDLTAYCKQIQHGIMSSSTLTDTLTTFESWATSLLHNDVPNVTMEKAEQFLKSFDGIQRNIQVSAQTLDQNYFGFPDYVIPLQDSLNSVQIGLSMLQHSVNVLQCFDVEARMNVTHEEFFPALMGINAKSNLTPIQLINFAKYLQKSNLEDEHVSSPTIVENVIVSLLLKYKNIVLFEGISSSHLQHLLQLFDYVGLEWKIEQDRKAKIAEEKISIYKANIHMDDANEDEEDEQNFQKMFGKPQETPLTYNDQKSQSECQFSENIWQTAMEVYSSVMQIIGSYTDERNHRKDTNKDSSAPDSCESNVIDISISSKYSLSSLHESFRLASSNMHNMGIDKNILSANLNMIKHIKDSLQKDQNESNDFYNVYKMPHVGEVLQCLPVLRQLMNRIYLELLKEWPEHPTLLRIGEILSRIMNLSATLPLINYILGLETLVEVIQEWEKNATSSVSLQSFLEQITGFVFKWRKMELNGWNKLLADEFQKLSCMKPSLFFSLYKLIQNPIDDADISDFITHLEQYMESSSISQFSSRLHMLHIFGQYLSIKGQQGSNISICLKNVHDYYVQYLNSVNERIQALSQPIAKELTDFVKITRWSDQNFFAMKETVDKTHRHLFKFVKKFNQAMSEGVQFKILVQTSSATESSSFALKPLLSGNAKITCVNVEIENTDSIVCFDKISNYLKDKSQSDEHAKYDVLHRLNFLKQKLLCVCADSKVEIGYLDKGLISIENFIKDVIENANHLKNLQPSTPLPKQGDESTHKKRLSEMKNIKLRKQKALNDLFKNLKQLGFSYKKGIFFGQNLSSLDLLKSPVYSDSSGKIATSIKIVDSGRISIVRDIKLCSVSYQRYFFSNIAKWSTFSLSSSKPHKDLTRSNVERARGFIGCLMELSLSQKKELCSTLMAKIKLDKSVKLLEIVRNVLYCNCQSETAELIRESKILVDDWCMLLHELMLWFDCCPKHRIHNDDSSDPLYGQSVKFILHGDQVWLQSMDIIKNCIEAAHNAKKIIDGKVEDILSSSQICLVTVVEMKSLSEQMCKMSLMSKDLSGFLLKTFSNCCSLNLTPKLVSDICDFTDVWENHNVKINELSEISPKVLPNSDEIVTDILENTNTLISTILLRIQNTKKYIRTFPQFDELPGLEDNLFTKNLHDKVIGMIQTLCVSDTCENISHFSDLVAQWISTNHRNLAESASESVHSVIQEYRAILVVALTSLEGLHHTTSKLCHVLGKIFINLCQNGFCTPPEMEEPVDEDMTELGDAEGGGVGDGEGTNNVSDEIDETMLEEAGDKSEEKDNENAEKDGDAVEMSNDFDGELGDHVDQKSDNESNQETDDEDEDIEKQMGELGEDEIEDKLDEQFWGSEEEEELNESNKKEEKGKGMEKSESELAAKDSDLNEEELQEQGDKDEDDRPCDDAEFDPSENDLYNDEDKVPEQNENNFDIADDSKIDDQEEDNNEVDEEVENENFDLPNKDMESDVNEEGELNEQNVAEKLNEEDLPSDDEELKEENAFDAQASLEVDDNMTKDHNDNTINENQSKSEIEHSGDVEHDNTPPENPEPQSFRNEGNAPSDGNWDDTNMQSSCAASQSRNDNVDTKINTKRREPDSLNSDPEPLTNESIEKRLNIVDAVDVGKDIKENTETDPRGLDSDAFQHIDSPTAGYDKKTLDSVQQDLPKKMDMIEEEVGELECQDLMDWDESAQGDDKTMDDETKNVQRKHYFQLSEIHTDITKGNHMANTTQKTDEQLNEMRLELENQLQLWRKKSNMIDLHEAENAWECYCNLTRPLAIELCEQLRLVLEPTKASQLKGDYRTGKRLNIRKIIPYVASGFRKDKIWLRRTKANRRMYQIMLAVDDSSSMIDNHTKQLAFESVAVISGALSSLEVGQLAICSFGEQVQLLQNFDDPLSTKSGATILSKCTFTQKKTKIAEFLEFSTDFLQTAKRRYSSNAHPNISQLLLIISDGRGLYLEGRKRVLEAVGDIKKSRVFVVFIILDQPSMSHGSITDIKVPVFNKPGDMPEIRSYMKDFPFPFYLILRDVNVLPQTLGDALRQWFELVVGSE